MLKNNKKGFTLVEVIVAMCIMTIAMGIGYKVFNGSIKSIKSQQVITDAQLNANLVNKYLTKDLERCIELGEVENNEKYQYGYKLKLVDRYIYYLVYIDYDKKEFNVVRRENSSDVEVISKQKLDKKEVSNNIPFKIESVENRNLYKVSVSYSENKKNKLYIFDVNPRVFSGTYNGGNDSGGGSEDNGGEEVGFKVLGEVGFGINQDYISTWRDEECNQVCEIKHLATELESSSKDKAYEISSKISPGNNGNGDYNKIGNLSSDDYGNKHFSKNTKDVRFCYKNYLSKVLI